jgi:cytoskeleton protein RodZ
MADMLTLNSGKSVRSDAQAKQERGRSGRNGVPAPVQSIGPLLRERREAMGVTLAEAEVATRIRQKYLAALEADEWDLLPGEVVGRGFLRNYSTYLGLEPTEMIERRRAVADDSMAAVLVNTSAGSALPPERKVDYRPKDVALKDEGDDLDAPRQINWAPLLALLSAGALLALAYLGITQLGPQMGEMAAAGQRQIEAWQAAPPPVAEQEAAPGVVATLPPNLTAADVAGGTAADGAAGTDAQVAAGVAAAAGDTAATAAPEAPAVAVEPTPAPVDPPAAPVDAPAVAAVPADVPADVAGDLSLTDLLPAPTPLPLEPAPAAAAPAATAGATVNTGANLRSGPGTEYPILAGLPAGDAIAITGRNAEGTWFVLSDGSWVFGELVTNPPVDVPVVAAPPVPAPVEAAPVEAAPVEAAPVTP